MTIRIIAGDITKFDGDAIINAANNRGLGGGGVDGAIHRAAGPGLLGACESLPLYPGLQGLREGMRPTDEVRVPNGSAVPTPAFDLPCRWIIHTAGPVWPVNPDTPVYVPNDPPSSLAGVQPKLGVTGVRAEDIARRTLRDCYKMPALVAVGMGMRSIAYPAISAGVYGCPMKTCAEVALQWALDYIQNGAWPLDVTFYIFPEDHLDTWKQVAQDLGIQR